MTVRRYATTGLLTAATVVFAVGMLAAPEQYRAGVSHAGTLAMSAVAAVCSLLRSAGRSGRARWTWIGIGLGAAAYAAGDGAWLWTAAVRGAEVSFPSAPHIGYLAMPPLVAAGVLIAPVAGQSAANRMRSIVDGLIIATSLLLIAWVLVIGPLTARNGGEPRTPALLAYPAADVVLIAVVCYLLALLRRGGRDSVSLTMIAAALVLIGAADAGYAYAALAGAGTSGGPADVGWFAGFALVALAARRRDRAGSGDNGGEGTDGQQPFAIVLPYAAVVLALLFSPFQGAGAGAFATWSRSVLILLIVGRQLLTLLENRHLTRHLEARVAARTAELYASEQRFRALVQQSSDSVAVITADSTVRYQTESVERIFGWPARLLIGRRLTEIAGRWAGPRIAEAIESLRGRPYATTVIELHLRHRDGRLRLAEMTMTNLLDDPSVRGIVVNARDVHDAKELQDQLMHEAYHDGLTGLASRALFAERLQGALEAGRHDDAVAILFLDLDGFKEVNDSLGHAAGDQLLVQIADRLRAAVRDGDTVARLGGDEFAVLVESATAVADAEALARRVVAAVGRPVPIGGREMHVGASVGLASAADAGDIERLMRNADLAMYKAKAAGGSGLAAYDPAMHGQLMDRLELEADLRGALDRGELALQYQPTVELATGEIVGFEALVRWYHPTRGVVRPLDFIGIAEATGLIVPLGRWVLAEACRQAVAWGAGTTRALKMAVNVSVRQFDHCDLAAMVADVLAETGMPVGQLVLEMTESVLLSDTDENLTQLHRLKALGVTLAMDDFGTGYSSLAYLRRFPLDVLKIDRSFVERLGGDASDVALVRTIVRLGQSLGLATVAEGIQNAGQLAALREMGCDFAQGYHLSHPLPAGEAGRLLALELTPGGVG